MQPEGAQEMNAKSDIRVSTENQSSDSQRSVYQESLAILDTGFGSFSLAEKIEHMSLHTAVRNHRFEAEVAMDSPTAPSPILPRSESHNYRSISSERSFESSQFSRRESSSTALTATTYDQESDSDDEDLKLGKLRYYIVEAERLKSSGELRRAAPFFRVIIKQLSDNPGLERSLKHPRLHYIVELVDIQTCLKNWSDALITIQNTLGGSDDPALAGLVEHWQAWVYHRQGSLDSAKSRCERAIKKIRKVKGRHEDSVKLMLQILEDMGEQDPEGKEEYEVEASFYRSLVSPIELEAPDQERSMPAVELEAKSDLKQKSLMIAMPRSAGTSQHQGHGASPPPSIREENRVMVFDSLEENRKILQKYGLDDPGGGNIIRVVQTKGGKNAELVAIREAITKKDMVLAGILFNDPKMCKHKMEVKYAGWGGDESEPLHFAVMNNNIDVVKLLLSKGVDLLSTTTKWKLTVLHIASLTPNVGCEMMEFLTDSGVPVDGLTAPESACRSLPLHLACAARENSESIAKLEFLLKRGASVNVRDFYNASPLMVAAMVPGSSVHLKKLVDAGALVGDSDSDGDTALHIAAKNLNAEGIKVLLDCGANRGVKNNKGKRPIDLAKAQGDCPAEIKTLLKPENKPARRWF